MPLDRLTQITSSGISSNSTITVSAISGTINATGISTFSSGPVLIGSGTSTGTTSQPLQVTGGAYVSGRLGIGITNPQFTLHNYSTSYPTFSADAGSNKELRLQFHTGNNTANVTSIGAFPLVFQTNSLERARIDANGVFLVGTANSTGTASQPLQVTGGAYVSGRLGIGRTNPGTFLEIDGTGTEQFRVLGSSGGYFLAGYDNTNSRARIGSYKSGWTDLTINEGGGNVLINATSATGTASQPLQVTGGAYVSGNLGIGTTNPLYKLDLVGGTLSVGGGAGDSYLTAYSDVSGANVSIEGINRANTVKKNITLNAYGGNVGVGLTNPGYKLDVNGELFLRRADASSEGGQLSLARSTDNTQSWVIDVYGNTSTPSLRFVDAASSTVRMQIDGSGRVTKAYQPAFHANRTSGTESNAGTVNELGYSNVIVNVGGHYSGSTFRFTAPVNGTYFFYASTIRSANNFGSTKIRKNQTTQYSFNEFTSYTNNSHHYGICIMDMSAGDYASVQANNYAIDQNDYFGGYLLG